MQPRRGRHDDQHRRIPRAVRQVPLHRDPRRPPGTADRLVRRRNRLGAVGFAGCRASGGVLPAHVQSAARARRALLLGHPHERIVHGRPTGTAVDRPDRHRQGDVVQRLPAQRKHLRLFGKVAGRGRRRGRPAGGHTHRQRQHHRVLGFVGRCMTSPTSLQAAPSSALDIPETPDLERMRRETGARLRSAMADRGVDALILLGNNSVVYATGWTWPLGDPGLSPVERPVAVVLADDPPPHLFLPFREGAASESGLPADHLHGPVYLEFDEGVETFARVLADLVPAAAVIAVDELTGAMRRAQDRLFRSGRPADAAQIVGAAKLIKTPDELACMRTACRITDAAMVDVQAALAPGIRQIELSAGFMRRAFELGAMASMLEPIWQVMPKYKADGVWTTHGDLALPLLTTERERVAGGAVAS